MGIEGVKISNDQMFAQTQNKPNMQKVGRTNKPLKIEMASEAETAKFEDAQRVIFDRHMSYQNQIYKALYSGSDPIKNTTEHYFEMAKQISSEYEGEAFDHEMLALDNAYNNWTKMYADSEATLLKWVGSTKSNMNSNYKHISGIDDETVVNIRKDIVNMFENARDYYRDNDSFEGITEEIITGDSKTLNYTDLKFLNNTRSMVHVFIAGELERYVDEDTFIKNGEKIVKKIEDSNHSDFTKKMFKEILQMKA